MRILFRKVVPLIGLLASCTVLFASSTEDRSGWSPPIPKELSGPYIIDPDILADLDRSVPGCRHGTGPLNFQCLVYRDARSASRPAMLASNPFRLPVFEEVRRVVTEDLAEIAANRELSGWDEIKHASEAKQLSPDFLKYAGATIELVGVVNRMDRSFNPDKVPEHGTPSKCGEISAIYRFAYEGDLPQTVEGERHYGSRLPVTMNVVFPAAPWSGGPDCRHVAQRWTTYMRLMKEGAPPADIRRQVDAIVSSLHPEDIDRIELNMQGSRAPASSDVAGNFGTLATYIIRVFRWTPETNHWEPSHLANQIDRARLLGNPVGDGNTCPNMRGVPVTRSALQTWLTGKGLSDIDDGIPTIPIQYLACRALSVSPGGPSRSRNQPFWNARSDDEQIIPDDVIDAALTNYVRVHPAGLRFIKSADDFRTRLNDATCSGCHQTRAIAGFHMPGADRPGTSPVNAVYLPGSPHFFGDQARRAEIVQAIATSRPTDYHSLAVSYAARPLNRFSELKPRPDGGGIQLLGGWGAVCMVPEAQASTRRSWSCVPHLSCRTLFKSANQPGVGTCVNPEGHEQIGEAVQDGEVTSTRFGVDLYERRHTLWAPVSGELRDTRISYASRPAPDGNSYYVAHQEAFGGGSDIDKRVDETDEQQARRVRDQGTGGFPAGSLRLSQCVGLPEEATCALLAASGFNRCLEDVANQSRTPASCFRAYTNYAGVRACDPSNPCRDDYICLQSLGYSGREDAKRKFETREIDREAEMDRLKARGDNRYKLLAIKTFGESMPDATWLARAGGRGDRRGVCIPPYFVFQFKADGHVVPTVAHRAH